MRSARRLDSSSTKAMVMPRCGWRGRCACSGWTLVGWTRAEGGLVPPLMRMTAAPAWLALGPLSLRELAFRQGDQAAARSWTTQSLEHAQLLGHPSTVALAHTNLARIALRDGDAGAIERHAQLGSRRRGRICTRAAGRCTCSPGPLTPLATWRGPGRCSWTAWSFVGGWATGWGRRSS